jgi:hypothetical protein
MLAPTTVTSLAGLEDEVDRLLSRAWDPPPDLGPLLLRLGRAIDRLAGLRALWSERFESGGEWALDGSRSGSTWVASRSIEHPATARGRVHAGRDLRSMPAMADAVLRGDVRLGHVRLLATAARSKEHRRAAMSDVDEMAASTAARFSEPRFARWVDAWAALVDAEHDDQLRARGLAVPVVDHAADEQAERRELFLSRYGADGMWALNGTLDTETGIALKMALESVSEAIRDADGGRSLAQLRHDALGVLLSGELSAGLPVHKGVRPHVLVVVAEAGDDVHGSDLLAAPVPGGLVDRTDGDTGLVELTRLARRRVTCDAVLQRLTVDGDGIPLALGRSVRVVPPALRRVIDVRDRHCTFAGCTAPAIWCQAHHLMHWEDGGPTDERNVALLCSFHHRAVHERGFQVRWTPDGTALQTLRPEGTPVEIPLRR